MTRRPPRPPRGSRLAAALLLAPIMLACGPPTAGLPASPESPARSPVSLDSGVVPSLAPSAPLAPLAPTGRPEPGPTIAPVAADELPTCRYDDQAAPGDPATDWPTLLLDTMYGLPADFTPLRLASTERAGLGAGFEVIRAAIDDLRAMHEASVEAGQEVAIVSAYRSYAYQAGVFDGWVRRLGRAQALRVSARPGHSEHQLGTAVDVRSAASTRAPWDYDDWMATGPGTWMAQNAWRYGFVLSYPKGMEDETCYAYEPWHYRYVGRDVARQVHDGGETLRRFLWDGRAPGRTP